MEEYGLKNDLEEVARQWIVMSGNDIDQELLWTFLKRSKEAMDWLLPITVADGLAPRLVDCIYPIAPYREFYGAHSFPPKGNIRGSYVPKALYNYAQKMGIECRFKTPVTQLIQDASGRVCGAYAKGENGIIRIDAKYGVVLATGDIGGDEEMCRAYAPDALRTLASQYIPVGCRGGIPSDDASAALCLVQLFLPLCKQIRKALHERGFLRAGQGDLNNAPARRLLLQHSGR